MNFGNNSFNYNQEAFPQHQGVQQIFTNQAEDTSFHGFAPTTGSGVITQPGFWPEHHGYQPQQHSGLLGSATAQPQFLPVSEIQVLHPAPLLGHHGGVTIQGRAVPFDRQLQGSMVFVDALGHQHGTSVVSHPQLQAPLVTMGSNGLQYSASMAFTAPQMRPPVMYGVANGQQLGASGPFLTPQPRAPVMLIDGPALLHGAPVPVYSAGLQHGNAVALNSQVPPFVAVNSTHLQPVAYMLQGSSAPMQVPCNPQLPAIEQLSAGPSSANPTRPAPVVKHPSQQCQQDPKAFSSSMPGSAWCTQSCGTMASSRPVATKTAVADKPKKTWDEDLRAMLGCPVPSSTICSQESLVTEKKSKKRRAEGAKQKDKGPSTNNQAPNTALTKITKDQAPKKARTEINKYKEAKTAPTVLPKESKEAGKNKDNKRKHKSDAGENTRKKKCCKRATSPKEKTTKSTSRDEEDKPVFHKLGNKVERPTHSRPQQSRPQPSRPQPSGLQERRPEQSRPQQSRPQQSGPQPSRPQPSRPQSGPPESPEYKPRPKHYRSIDEVPHYYKNHSEGSVGRYGDGETIIYRKPEKGSKGLFPIPLVNLPPLPPGAPRRFHCREYSIPVPTERREQIEAMKRKAQAKREEDAKITGTGMNCNVLAERQHLPYVWPCEDGGRLDWVMWRRLRSAGMEPGMNRTINL
ncbi:serine/arginine repetitive matrix protein 1-like [Engraulis encrasicolus]|uniref:serine/arginine repetitive matrix protein 1-like n=1 Tax=Engraulis encrasicolus TaxID=184585 RepID=UPI002FD2C9DF